MTEREFSDALGDLARDDPLPDPIRREPAGRRDPSPQQPPGEVEAASGHGSACRQLEPCDEHPRVARGSAPWPGGPSDQPREQPVIGHVTPLPGLPPAREPTGLPMIDALHPGGPRLSFEVAQPLVVDQPPPVPSDRQAVWDLVIADMQDRDQVGRDRYGTPLQPFNGRDAMVDAYQECLDLCVYLRQVLAERPSRRDGLSGTATARIAWGDALRGCRPLVIVREVKRMLIEARDHLEEGSPQDAAMAACLARLDAEETMP